MLVKFLIKQKTDQSILLTKCMIKKLNWDSEFFNLKIGEVSYKDSKSLNDQLEFDLLYVYSYSNFELQIKNFENTFSEVKLSFVKKISANKFIEPKIFSINDIDVNVNVIYELAFESGKNSRFLLDEKFSSNDFKRLYKKWVDNSVSKTIAEDILIYYDNNKVEGFVSYKIENKNATIGLIAVASNSQGKGIGGKLLNQIESILDKQNIEKLIIPTQLVNTQACNFYKKHGYFIEETKYIKHYWKK